MEIERHLKAYLEKREPTARYTSFDYCFNYFQSHREQGKLPDLLEGDALQLSRVHLGFYRVAAAISCPADTTSTISESWYALIAITFSFLMTRPSRASTGTPLTSTLPVAATR